nr:uncharacterized protein LOC100204451 [Hydra vulgaris]
MRLAHLDVKKNNLNYKDEFYSRESPCLIARNQSSISNRVRYDSKPLSSCSCYEPFESSEDISSSVVSYNDLSSLSMDSLADDGFMSSSASISKRAYNQLNCNESFISYSSSLQSNQSDQAKYSGILKRTKSIFDEEKEDFINTDNTQITLEIINKIQENELEDILQYADDIISPDPSTLRTCSSQPVKIVEGSFRHILSVKDLSSKSFKYRTIEISKKDMPDLGFSVRKGDGWENISGVYISRVCLGSIFDKYELLTVGDEIVQINKIEVHNMSIPDVIKIMQIPRRLCLTVKILTPFTCKKNRGNDVKHKYFSKPISYDKYKIAQLKINTQKNNKTKTTITTLATTHNLSKKTNDRLYERSNGSNKSSNLKTERNNITLSPYRTMEGGNAVQLNKQCLLSVPNKLQQNNRKTSFVTWSDLTYNNN